jgi:peptidoglycan/LPS O-acetylase OafA/YrhL
VDLKSNDVISAPSSPEPQQLPALTSLRFFAALVVVAFHAQVSQVPWLPHIVKVVCNSGYQAVTFFFVLSGFILTHVYAPAERSEGLAVTDREFWRRRARRILPAYYLGLILGAPSVLYGIFVSHNIVVGNIWLSLFLALVLLQAWAPPFALTWNAPAWSLSVEAFFYAVFPALIRSIRRVGCWTIFTAAIGIAFLNGVFHALLIERWGEVSDSWHNFFGYFPLFHLPAFVFGIAVARLQYVPALNVFGIRRILFWGGCAGALAVLDLDVWIPVWMPAEFLLVVLFGAIVLGAARLDGLPYKILALSPLIFLGDASYAIYILHVPISFWWEAVQKYALGLSGPYKLNAFLDVGMIVAIAVILHVYVEQKLGRRIFGYLTVPGRARK